MIKQLIKRLSPKDMTKIKKNLRKLYIIFLILSLISYYLFLISPLYFEKNIYFFHIIGSVLILILFIIRFFFIFPWFRNSKFNLFIFKIYNFDLFVIGVLMFINSLFWEEGYDLYDRLYNLLIALFFITHLMIKRRNNEE